MAEGAGQPAGGRQATGFIRNPQDFWGGMALLLFALFTLWAGSDLPGMRGFAFGPGTAPRMRSNLSFSRTWMTFRFWTVQFSASAWRRVLSRRT